MAKTAIKKFPMAYRAAKKPFCLQPDVKDLTPEQIASLHVFLHEVIASMFRLYQTVPFTQADPIVDKFLVALTKYPEDE